MPPMVGLMVPFRIGLIGDAQSKWCIFDDEAVFKDDWPTVRKMPRRSPEVWLSQSMSDRVMDPARYRNIARYSMGAFPSGTIRSLKNILDQREATNMDQEAIQAIVSAVTQGIVATPQWQFLTDQMQTAQNPISEASDQGPTPGTAVTDPDRSARWLWAPCLQEPVPSPAPCRQPPLPILARFLLDRARTSGLRRHAGIWSGLDGTPGEFVRTRVSFRSRNTGSPHNPDSHYNWYKRRQASGPRIS